MSGEKTWDCAKVTKNNLQFYEVCTHFRGNICYTTNRKNNPPIQKFLHPPKKIFN